MTTPRELLDREIGGPPPSTIDVDALIAGQRMRGRIRTAGLGTLTAAMVLAIAAVLVLLPPRAGMEWDRNVGASPSPSVAPNSRAAEAARLTAALRQLISQALPGAMLSKAPASMRGMPPAEPLSFADYGTHFAGAAVVTDGLGSGTITVSVGKEDTQFRADGQCMTDPAPLDVKFHCEVIPGPDGANIMKVTSEIGDDNYRRFYVEIIRSDGNAVSVDVTNGVFANNDPYRGQRPTPLLSLDQAVALVQEPSLATTLS